MKIWNGNEFLEVSDKEGKALVKADKAQEIDEVLSGRSNNGAYKFRAEFSGYKTREMKAQKRTRKATKKTKPKK